jgi:hypothetical protein
MVEGNHSFVKNKLKKIFFCCNFFIKLTEKMSKGCFQVIGYEYRIYDEEGEESKIKGVTASQNRISFVPKNLIVSTHCYTSYAKYRKSKSRWSGKLWHHQAIDKICVSNGESQCICKELQKLKLAFEDCKTDEARAAIRPALQVAPDCLCNLTIFPLYMIVVKNKMRIEMEREDCDTEYFVPKLVNCFVASSEREHMERYLAGTDDPLYDYVHHLKYNPANGSEALAAQEDFEKAGKRQKLENSQI